MWIYFEEFYVHLLVNEAEETKITGICAMCVIPSSLSPNANSTHLANHGRKDMIACACIQACSLTAAALLAVCVPAGYPEQTAFLQNANLAQLLLAITSSTAHPHLRTACRWIHMLRYLSVTGVPCAPRPYGTTRTRSSIRC